MSAGLAELMAELDKAGMRVGQDKNGVWTFIPIRKGGCGASPDLVAAIRARWADAVAWAEGRYTGADADSRCSLCSSWVTPLGVKEGMVFGLCDRRTEPTEFDKKTVLCPYRRK